MRDPKLVARAKAMLAPLDALSDQMTPLGEKQSALGKQQSALGEKMRTLSGDPEHNSDAMSELGRKMEGLGKQQEGLGQQQEAIGKKMEAVAHELETKLGGLLDEARAAGLADSRPISARPLPDAGDVLAQLALQRAAMHPEPSRRLRDVALAGRDHPLDVRALRLRQRRVGRHHLARRGRQRRRREHALDGARLRHEVMSAEPHRLDGAGERRVAGGHHDARRRRLAA